MLSIMIVSRGHGRRHEFTEYCDLIRSMPFDYIKRLITLFGSLPADLIGFGFRFLITLTG